MNTRAFLLNLVNCLLCAWIWLGGIFAVFLYKRLDPTGMGLTIPSGLALGAVAGIIAAIIGGVISLAFTSTAGTAAALEALRSQPELAPYVDQVGGYLAAGGASIIGTLCNGVVYAVFGAIGGLIGAAIWKPKQQVL